MKHLKAKTKRARFFQGITKYIRGAMLGAFVVIVLNSNGEVIQISSNHKSVDVVACSMKSPPSIDKTKCLED